MRTWVPLIATLAAVAAVSLPHGRLRAEPSASSRLHWITNGPVWAGATLGDRLFVSGAFTRVAPTTGALGAIFAVDAASGAVAPGLPLVDGGVQAVVADGGGGAYIAGNFGRVGDTERRYVAHLRSDGTLDPGFAPEISLSAAPSTGETRPLSLALTADALVVAGPLSLVNGVPRGAIVAFDRVTGTPRSWGPPVFWDYAVVAAADGQLLAAGLAPWYLTAASLDSTSGAAVWQTTFGSPDPESRLALAVAGPRLIVGGRFQRTDDGHAHSLAALDRSSGALDESWKPAAGTLPDLSHLPAVEALAVDGQTLYVGGRFTELDGQARANLAAVDIPTGTVTPWAPTSNDRVSALAISPGGVWAGGAFTAVGGTARDKLVELDATGNVTAWQAQVYPTAVSALQRDGSRLVIAGRMALVGGAARDRLAAFDLATDALLPWAPVLPGDLDVTAIAATQETVLLERSRTVSPLERDIVAVSATAGPASAPSWVQPPAPAYYTRLLTASGPYVYAMMAAPGTPTTSVVLRRLFAASGALDLSWSPSPVGANVALVDSSTLVLGAATVSGTPGALHAVDVPTGVTSPWAPVLGSYSPEPPWFRVGGLGTDGGTLLFVTNPSTYFPGTTGAVDATSGMTVRAPLNLTGFGGDLPSFGSAAGETLLSFGSVTRREQGAVGIDQGDAVVWTPGLSPIAQRTLFETRPAPVLVTPTDVVVLGQERVTPSVIHGLGVFPLAPARAPHGLRWSATGSLVTFSWHAPAPAPSGYVLEASTDRQAPPAVTMPLGPVTSFTTPAPDGTFFVRVRRADDPAAPPSNQVAVVVGCTAPPPAPLDLSAAVTAGVVTFTWTPAPFSRPTGYALEAGTSRGGRDIASLPLSSGTSSFSAVAPPGTYFVRVRAVNTCGPGRPTSDAEISIGAGPLPPAPAAPTVAVAGGQVTLSWPSVAGALSYVLEVGSAPRQTDVLTTEVTATGLAATSVPPGHYYVRVRARSAAGLGPPSEERLAAVAYY
ncbi:MAG: hypothetical protein R2708_04325 [Vicinamibacterales bacterium]